MMKPLLGVAIAGLLVAACGQKSEATDDTAGPVVAPSAEPRNDAVNTAPATAEPGPTPGANSFTQAQARSAIEGAGYTEVSEPTQDASGVWKATATKDGAPATVTVDYKGAVTALPN
jgi:hypothetical protein